MRLISEIAKDIRAEWGAKVNYAAKPYLDAMRCIDMPGDNFGYDDSKDVVLRFLCNASSFRGERARELKRELKAIFNIK
jgi:hypothetical protein